MTNLTLIVKDLRETIDRLDTLQGRDSTDAMALTIQVKETCQEAIDEILSDFEGIFESRVVAITQAGPILSLLSEGHTTEDLADGETILCGVLPE